MADVQKHKEFCLERVVETQAGLCHGTHPVDAGVNFIHEQTHGVWKQNQSIEWSVRYKCWKLNFRSVTDWAARLMFLDDMNLKRERGLTSGELGRDLEEEGLVPIFWEPHSKQKVPNIIGDVQYLLLNMKRLFPGKYSDFQQRDVIDLVGKFWRLREEARDFLWQEYGESYKQCLRGLREGPPGQSKASLINVESSEGDNYLGQYVVQLLICSSLPDQIYVMLKVSQITFDKYRCEVLNVRHYTMDRGDGTKWHYFQAQEKTRYGRWNEVHPKDKLPHIQAD